MDPLPQAVREHTTRRLEGRRALISGGDSGIGRAVAIAFAKEGARVALLYLDEHGDARETRRLVEDAGGEAVLHSGDVGDPDAAGPR